LSETPVAPPEAAQLPVSRKIKGPAPRAAPPQIRSKPQIGSTLDGSWDRAIRSGKIEPDRTLDLHGMNLDSAWNAIDQALERAISSGERVLLLITGHARAGEPPIKRGRIRAAVHDWLAASRHASRIAAVRGAHRRHGGGGSLYLILRRG
jgi:DNA-nicking Smr family endonuclease